MSSPDLDPPTETPSPEASPPQSQSSTAESPAPPERPVEKTLVERARDGELADPTRDRYECRSCGYVYEPLKGDERARVAPNTAFEDLPEGWRCPVCGARASQFQNVGPVGLPSGFEENLNYGLGVNQLTPGAKNLLIFGGLILAFFFMISLYGLR